MDQLQPNSHVMPHIVQVYQRENKMQNPQLIPLSQRTIYQQLNSQLGIPISINPEIHNIIPQEILVQNHQVTPHILHGQELGQSVHVTHLPLLFNNTTNQIYGHFYQKEDSTVIEIVHEENNSQKQVESEQSHNEEVVTIRKKKNRSSVANPGSWACNVRKAKHQKGEAYVSRRGKYVPEKKVRNLKDCMKSCKFKCSINISDNDRQELFKAFYSLNTNEKRLFLLSTTERSLIKSYVCDPYHKKRFSFKYFFIIRSNKYTVCKNFYLGTLAISQKPVYNVHLSKSDFNIPKPDGRGFSENSTHTLPTEVKDRVKKHIMSFQTTDSKPIKVNSKKKQFLPDSLSIKQLYKMYEEVCLRDNYQPVKESMYRKIFKSEFNLHFKKVCRKCKEPIQK